MWTIWTMWKRIAAGSIGLMILVVAVLAVWYQVDGQPLPEAAGYLTGPGYTSETEPDGTLVFVPATPNGQGILIMHGALIKPLAYAKAGAYFAARGYTVYIPSGPARLSVNVVDAAARRLPSFGLNGWFLIGHSMGGFSSLELVTRHQLPVRGMAFWACAMPADYSQLRLPMLYLYGDRDGLLPPERLADARSKLPPDVNYVAVAGGNHRGFALYSHQFFDGEATLTPAEQTDFALERTVAFFANLR
jgi:pimeloyl-ACP methyl ester carboxylesterase